VKNKSGLKVKEKAIETQILHFLAYKGIMAWKIENQGTFDAKKGIYRRKIGPGRTLGVSDIVGLLPNGRLFAIEVKSATGRISEHQEQFLNRIKQNEGLAFIARSIEDVIYHLGLKDD
jgi:hypothetical protein